MYSVFIFLARKAFPQTTPSLAGNGLGTRLSLYPLWMSLLVSLGTLRWVQPTSFGCFEDHSSLGKEEKGTERETTLVVGVFSLSCSLSLWFSFHL